MKALWFLNNDYLGEGEIIRELGDRRPVTSIAYLCPRCGDVWARVAVEGASYWFAAHASCPRCAPYHSLDVPGSLWMGHDLRFNDSMPDGLIKRELELALQAAEAELRG